MGIFKRPRPVVVPEAAPVKPYKQEIPTTEYELVVASLSYALVAMSIPDSTYANKSSFPKEVAWDAEMMVAAKQVHDTVPDLPEDAARRIGALLTRTVLELKGWELPPDGWSSDSLFEPI
jgi:hypothetical protein